MIGVNARTMCARALAWRQAANHASLLNGSNLHQRRGEVSEPKPSGLKEKTLEVLWPKITSTAGSYTCRRNFVTGSYATIQRALGAMTRTVRSCSFPV